MRHIFLFPNKPIPFFLEIRWPTLPESQALPGVAAISAVVFKRSSKPHAILARNSNTAKTIKGCGFFQEREKQHSLQRILSARFAESIVMLTSARHWYCDACRG
ncbi:MAG: hypothetical protein ACYC1T_06000 [Sulfuricaulis sp.]